MKFLQITAILALLFFNACDDDSSSPSKKKQEQEQTTKTNHPPQVTISAQTAGKINKEMTFTANATDEDGDSLTYVWYIDGTEQNGKTQKEFKHSFDSEKTYQVKVQVSDSKLEKNATHEVTITAIAPPTITMKTTSPQKVGEIIFDADVKDPDGGGIDKYEWKIDDKVVSTEKTFKKKYPIGGKHTIEFKVISKGGLSQTSKLDLTVNEVKCDGSVLQQDHFSDLLAFVDVPDRDIAMVYEKASEFNASTPVSLEPYQIGKYEVSAKVWGGVLKWAKANGYKFINSGKTTKDFDATYSEDNDTLPIVQISWNDAVVWLNAASEMTFGSCAPVYRKSDGTIVKDASQDDVNESIIKTDAKVQGFRLLTKKEYEFAARGGDDTNNALWQAKYVGGVNESNTSYDDILKPSSLWNYVEFRSVTSKKANALGLHNIVGNAGEYLQEKSLINDSGDKSIVAITTQYSDLVGLVVKFEALEITSYRKILKHNEAAATSGGPPIGLIGLRIARTVKE